MAKRVRISLPAEIASELVAEQVAARSISTRGGALADSISLGVDVINTGTAAVSLTVAGRELRRVAQAFLARRKATEHQMDLTLTIGGTKKSLRVDRTDPKAEDQIMEFLLSALAG